MRSRGAAKNGSNANAGGGDSFGACANSILYGFVGIGAFYDTDAFMRTLLISGLTCFVMGAGARNALYPKAAIAQVLCAEIPLLAACLAARDIYYFIFGLFIIIYVMAALAVVRHLYDQSVSVLRTNEEKAELVLAVGRANLELEAVNRQLEVLASTDVLSGLLNRRSFDTALATEVRSSQRESADLSLLMLDIDSFKSFNDGYGHQAGDDCLRRVAQAIKSSLRRPADSVARYGGEEFVAILPRTDIAGATLIAEEIRSNVEGLRLEHAAASGRVVTVSIGVATSAHDRQQNPQELIRLADEALYEAKRAGRNRVRVAARH